MQFPSDFIVTLSRNSFHIPSGRRGFSITAATSHHLPTSSVTTPIITYIIAHHYSSPHITLITTFPSSPSLPITTHVLTRKDKILSASSCRSVRKIACLRSPHSQINSKCFQLNLTIFFQVIVQPHVYFLGYIARHDSLLPTSRLCSYILFS